MDALMRIGYVLDDMTDELTQAALSRNRAHLASDSTPSISKQPIPATPTSSQSRVASKD